MRRPDATWAADRDPVDLPVRVTKHSSLLLRELSEDEMLLQHNKVTNLKLWTRRVDTILGAAQAQLCAGEAPPA